jgi:hypothetical protein
MDAVSAPRINGETDCANVSRRAISVSVPPTEIESENAIPVARIKRPINPTINQRLIPIPGRASNDNHSMVVGCRDGGGLSRDKGNLLGE